MPLIYSNKVKEFRRLCAELKDLQLKRYYEEVRKTSGEKVAQQVDEQLFSLLEDLKEFLPTILGEMEEEKQ